MTMLETALWILGFGILTCLGGFIFGLVNMYSSVSSMSSCSPWEDSMTKTFKKHIVSITIVAIGGLATMVSLIMIIIHYADAFLSKM